MDIHMSEYIALDVQYALDKANVACISFDGWQAANPNGFFAVRCENINPYEPGSFYKRELPCLITAIDLHKKIYGCLPKVIVIDGYCDLNNGKPGLGRHLFDALSNSDVVVIGVAKSYFDCDAAVKVSRGNTKPLYVTAINMQVDIAANYIRNMYGDNRIPDILKYADSAARIGI